MQGRFFGPLRDAHAPTTSSGPRAARLACPVGPVPSRSSGQRPVRPVIPMPFFSGAMRGSSSANPPPTSPVFRYSAAPKHTRCSVRRNVQSHVTQGGAASTRSYQCSRYVSDRCVAAHLASVRLIRRDSGHGPVTRQRRTGQVVTASAECQGEIALHTALLDVRWYPIKRPPPLRSSKCRAPSGQERLDVVAERFHPSLPSIWWHLMHEIADSAAAVCGGESCYRSRRCKVTS